MPDHRESILGIAGARAGAGDISIESLLWAAAGSRLVVPRSGAVTADVVFEPVTLVRGDLSFLAAFTAVERFAAVEITTREFLDLDGADLMSRVADETGLVVDPGTRNGFEVPSEGLHRFVADLGGYATTLDAAIARALAGVLPAESLMWALLPSRLVIPVADRASSPSGWSPLLARSGDDTVLPVYVSVDAAVAAGMNPSDLEEVAGITAFEMARGRLGVGLTGTERNVVLPAKTIDDFLSVSGLVPA